MNMGEEFVEHFVTRVKRKVDIICSSYGHGTNSKRTWCRYFSQSMGNSGLETVPTKWLFAKKLNGKNEARIVATGCQYPEF